MNKIKVLRIGVGGDARLVEVEPTGAIFHNMIGGWLEAINGDGWTAYLDEEGKLKRLPVNKIATDLVRQLGWQSQPGDVLVGPVVFVGPPTPGGNDTSVGQVVLQHFDQA